MVTKACSQNGGEAVQRLHLSKEAWATLKTFVMDRRQVMKFEHALDHASKTGGNGLDVDMQPDSKGGCGPDASDCLLG